MQSFLTRTVLSLIFLLTAGHAAAEEYSAIELARRLGLSADAIKRVAQGEVVSEVLEPSSDKDLALALVLRMDVPPQRVTDFVATDRLAKIQTVTLASGPIDPYAPSLDAMELPADALEAFANDPGGAFFMSEAEAKRVEAAAKQGKTQALDAYRKVLIERIRDYWENGLAGITPYAGKGRSPEADLRLANKVALDLVQNPNFRAELTSVPSKSPGKASHELYWAIEKGRDEAVPVLIHRVIYSEDGGEILLARHFYSGGEYDAIQILVGILPTEKDWSAVFYTNHTYTSQVAGFGGGAKRAIGRSLLEKELVAELERARAAITGR